MGTLWLFNIAMENDPFIDNFPMKTTIYRGFSMAMLNNQMVSPVRDEYWFSLVDSWIQNKIQEKPELAKISGWWWLEHDVYIYIYFSIYTCHRPNWRTHTFQRGRYITNQMSCRVELWVDGKPQSPLIPSWSASCLTVSRDRCWALFFYCHYIAPVKVMISH